MTKLFQTDATLAREQNSHLFEDTPDPCADKPKEPLPAEAAVLLDITVQQRQNNEKLMNDILHTVGKVQQNLDTCCARRFDTIVKKTAPGYRSGWLRANVESRYTHGQFGTVDYKTLALCQHGSFIKWPRTGPDGRTQYTSLQRCYFYPALITETMKMVFVRTTKKQITYLREEVVFGSAQRIGDTLFEVTVHFPKTDALHNNIIIYLKHTPGNEKCRLAFLFDGEQFHLNDLLPTEQFCEKGYVALIKKELLEAPEGLNKFLNYCFKPFRFAQLDSDCKDLGKYLRDSKYKVGMTEVVQTPFLILHKDNRVL